MLLKRKIVILKNFFWKFTVLHFRFSKNLIYGDFDPIKDTLSCCGGLRVWAWLFIKIYLDTLCHFSTWRFFFLTEHCKIKQKKYIFDQPNQKVIITSSISSTRTFMLASMICILLIRKVYALFILCMTAFSGWNIYRSELCMILVLIRLFPILCYWKRKLLV